jgi:predicted RNA-binding Zn-ribbon protein involved in translation (DUF1610 family)
MYDITISYGNHSGYIGKGGDTLEQAQRHMEEMLCFYGGYVIHEAYIVSYCPDCTQGKVKKCVAKRRHSNGYHGERCYKVCKTCKGHYETRHTSECLIDQER